MAQAALVSLSYLTLHAPLTMAPKKKIDVPVLAGQLPIFQQAWIPERAQDLRTISNWLIKLVRPAGTRDAEAMNALNAQGISEDAPLPDEVELPQYFRRTQPGETHLGELDFNSRRVILKWRTVCEPLLHGLWQIQA